MSSDEHTPVPIVGNLTQLPPAPPLRVTITAEHKDLEHMAVALALNVARADPRLMIRKLDGGSYSVESGPMDAAEYADLLDRVQGALVFGKP